VKLAAAVLLLATVPSAGRPKLIDLLLGAPKHATLNGVRLNYDGKDGLIVGVNRRVLRLSAKTPAQVRISRNGTFIVHNFGNGSGQVYDFRVYALRTGHALNVSIFKKHVLTFARAHTCRASPDQISYLVERWLSPTSLLIRTEDWTRRGCNRLNRNWTLRLS
jgi:hypothetical protein